MTDHLIDPAIEDHYAGNRPEDDRLRGGAGSVERARTQAIIRRRLPDQPLRVLDVGGASGVHAEWLSADGHSVHLIDPVPLHVEQAERAGSNPAHRFTASLGDARSLEIEDRSVDVVLLLGPLYHLTDHADRVQALREAARVVVPGGWVFAAAISRFASLLDGLSRGLLLDDPAFRAVVEVDLATGQHRNPEGRSDWFTTAYFHRPDELGEEGRAAGLEVIEVVGVEGFSAWSVRADPSSADDDRLATHVWAAGAIEHEPSLAGLSPHLLMTARAPIG